MRIHKTCEHALESLKSDPRGALGGLKKLYDGDKNLFASKPVINVDRHANNSMFGTINLVDPQASATTEIIAQLMSGLGVKLTVDIASNILNALYGATDGFSQANVTPLAFELAATCLRAGGKRFGAAEPQPIAPVVSVPVTSVPIQPLIKQPAPNAGGQTPADWLKPKIFKSSTNIS